MRQGPRRMVRSSFLALALASPMCSLLLTSVGPSSSLLRRSLATLGATATTARRRARPAWRNRSRRLVPSVAGCFSRLGGVGGQTGSHVPLAAGMKSSVSYAGAGSRPPPLTHEQLPEESIYILDGTSMLFRAFYGRGAGG